MNKPEVSQADLDLEQKSEKVEYVYIRKSDLARVYDGCDLGDSVSVRAYQYPHREYQEPDMVRFVAYSESKRVLSVSDTEFIEECKFVRANKMHLYTEESTRLLAIIKRLTSREGAR